jgi:hypothetical protein
VDGQAEIASAFIATGNYHEVLGVTARLGRPIAAMTGGRAGRGRHQLPLLAFAVMTDPNVLTGRSRVNDVPVTIVGVLKPEFTAFSGPEPAT